MPKSMWTGAASGARQTLAQIEHRSNEQGTGQITLFSAYNASSLPTN